ncbi:hypothetical protein [Parvularcula maris]|uniref:VPLPA-CTERM sorting domain-containing protein n=1 Tax=Parvularcula maris TaxID=2965077 RepID=A0A9X2RIK8_9PROT|nr:hypothetical protein [Parvularcula maris]MCQ8186119.1 hypothetical protein [Parvularcula maris]
MKRLITLVTAAAMGMIATAQAAVFATLDQTADGLQFVFSGTLDIEELTPFATVGGPATGFLVPANSAVGVQGEACDTCVGLYLADAPEGFATDGGFVPSNVFSIDGSQAFGFQIFEGVGGIALGDAYVSGSTLSGDAFFSGVTLAALCISAGTYSWTLLNGDFVSLTVSEVPVPAAALLFGPVLAGLAWRRGKKTA